MLTIAEQRGVGLTTIEKCTRVDICTEPHFDVEWQCHAQQINHVCDECFG